MEMTAEIHVFTFKDGLLARLAHDLRLTLRRFELRREETVITGTFWPGSLTVDGAARKGGEVDHGALSASDREKIAGNIADVLQVKRFPEVRLVAQLKYGVAITGELTLVGRTKPVRAEVSKAAGRLVAEVVLTPSEWGIAPYRALAGAIKLQDRVVVRVDLPADPGGSDETPDPCKWTAG
jgi:hypothetical protein